jgi:hypothetical protein
MPLSRSEAVENGANMQRESKVSRFLALFAVLAALLMSACTMNSESTQQPQDYPVTTQPLLKHFDDCWKWHDGAVERAEDAYKVCPDSGVYTPEQCNAFYQEEVANAKYYLVECVEQLPGVEGECRDNFDYDDLESDADGDGITDEKEVFIGTNPCEICSFGGYLGKDCDADWDWDLDGIDNGVDQNPICPEKNGEIDEDSPLLTYCI